MNFSIMTILIFYFVHTKHGGQTIQPTVLLAPNSVARHKPHKTFLNNKNDAENFTTKVQKQNQKIQK